MSTSTIDSTRVQPSGGMRAVDGLRGPAGRLEAVLNPGASAAKPELSVLLCHPHPLFGGMLHNKVVYHAMKTITGLGFPVLRFNFRGVGLSEGTHDAGRGEQDDARAGLDWLAAEFGSPVLAAGFSFGAHMALRAGCAHPHVAALASLGTPIQAADRLYDYGFLQRCRKPKLFLSGALDPFGPVDAVESALAQAPEPKEIVWIPEADHFFAGQLAPMQSALAAWVRAVASTLGSARERVS